MSYLDPRAGQNSGDDTSVPAPYAYGVPGETGSQAASAWHAGEDVPTSQMPVVPQEADKGKRGRRRAKGRGPKPVGRAGRNLPAAIGIGVGLVLVVLISLVIWPAAFLGVIAVAAVVGVYEMVRALRSAGADAPLIPLVAGSLLMVGLAWRGGPDALLLGLLVTIAASVIWRIADGAAAFRRDLTASVLIAIYVPFLLSFGVLLQLPDADGDGRWRVLCTLLAVVLSDTGGYAVGVFFGKHKMAPSISPGKTWEGFAGSVVSAAAGSALLLHFLLAIPFYWGLLFGALISVVAVAGDLAESMLKRDLGIKDMSQLLPGHGGLMDRLDSILFAVPVAYLLLTLIAPPG